ncbi:ABC transporter ATP-binding protein [Phaeacidiphilus oryzae]|uniref:ABC transporter ATP-binding protein n=1 Tax=Phaeacidiphilus oryzae TaxID=348818 RepID=UPI0005676506|nr:ATP-binding cassette domain-containing protein [Phaeacidiphilus oryzae]
MIELDRLTKRYGGKLAVDALTFSIPPGVVTGFLGPNGAGKSTTMRMILGLDHPTSGRVTIDGLPYAGLPRPLTSIGALLEAKAVEGGRSAYHHLLWLARSNGLPPRRVDEVLELVGLREVARRRSGGFSLGMGQRLGIAAALLGDPRILMFDEPVNGLDPEGILWIRNLMKGLAAEGRTVFVSSHLMSEMALTADHLIIIGRGRLLADVSMREFIDRNARSVVRVRTPQPDRLAGLLSGAGIRAEAGQRDQAALLTVEDADERVSARIGDLAAEHGVPLHELSVQRASLEEAFMAMTAESVEYHAGRTAAGTDLLGSADPRATPTGLGPGAGPADSQEPADSSGAAGGSGVAGGPGAAGGPARGGSSAASPPAGWGAGWEQGRRAGRRRSDEDEKDG